MFDATPMIAATMPRRQADVPGQFIRYVRKLQRQLGWRIVPEENDCNLMGLVGQWRRAAELRLGCPLGLEINELWHLLCDVW